MRPLRPVLAYHLATRRGYLFPGQTEAAKWLVAKGLSKSVNTARSNLIMAAKPPRFGYNRTRTLWGFVWITAKAGEVALPAKMAEDLARRLRIWALVDADWSTKSDNELSRALTVAGIHDPAEPASPKCLASAGPWTWQEGAPD